MQLGGKDLTGLGSSGFHVHFATNGAIIGEEFAYHLLLLSTTTRRGHRRWMAIVGIICSQQRDIKGMAFNEYYLTQVAT